MSRQDVLRLASLFVSKVKAEGIPIQKAFLFGSWAKGSATNESDIDICIVSPVFGKDYTSEITRLLTIAQTVDNRIESVPFKSGDIDDRFSSLANEIRETGIGLTVN